MKELDQAVRNNQRLELEIHELRQRPQLPQNTSTDRIATARMQAKIKSLEEAKKRLEDDLETHQAEALEHKKDLRKLAKQVYFALLGCFCFLQHSVLHLAPPDPGSAGQRT